MTEKSPRIDAESYAEFERKMLLFENGPMTTIREQLNAKDVDMPRPDEIPEASMRTKLWEVLVAMSDLRHYLDHTDHLSDRELYAKLWGELLSTEVPAVDEIGFDHHLHVIECNGDEPETSQYLRYFADEEQRGWWQEENPEYQMPPREDPPFNRDYLLPVSKDVQPPEAREWLKANWNDSALATNRFGPTTEAIKFVEELYAAGAAEVLIDNIMMLPNHDWTPYADTLIVKLPADSAQRCALFDLMEHAGKPDEDGPDFAELLIDSGQESVRLWWD